MSYVTKQYQAVLQCLEARDSAAFTAAELAEDLRLAGHPVGLATVYRQLDKLETAGVVHKVPTEEGALYQRCPRPGGGPRLLSCCGASLRPDPAPGLLPAGGAVPPSGGVPPLPHRPPPDDSDGPVPTLPGTGGIPWSPMN